MTAECAAVAAAVATAIVGGWNGTRKLRRSSQPQHRAREPEADER